MVGFLCSQKNEMLFVNHLCNNPGLKTRKISVIVFTMPNINLKDRTVYGTMIAEGKATLLKTELPSLIFNFAVQHTKSHIKKLNNMTELNNLTLFNSVNSFNQWTIMKILTSDMNTKPYVLPYVEFSSDHSIPDIQKIGNFILRPQSGSDYKKTVYCRKTDRGFDLFNVGDILYSHLFDIQSAVIPTIKNGKWILLASPDLVMYKNKLLIMRSYLYKNYDGKWNIALKTAISQTEPINEKPDKKIDAALLKMMGYINCFVKDLAFCSIDFVLSRDGTPYFLSLGGWQDLTPRNSQYKALFELLCQSMTEYSEKNDMKVTRLCG